MLKILADINSTELTSVEPAQIYDPRVNKYWRPAPARGLGTRRPYPVSMTVAEYLRFLEVLYSRENLADHSDFLMGHNLTLEQRQAIINYMPDDYLKFLGFIGNQGVEFWTLRLYPGEYYSDRNYLLAEVLTEDRLALLKTNLTQLKEFVDSRLPLGLQVLHGLHEWHGVPGYLCSMMSSTAYCLDVTMERVLEIVEIAADPEPFAIKLLIEEGGRPQLFYTANGGRQHLYRVFGYRTDVTQCIEGHITEKRQTKLGTLYNRKPGEPLYGIELELACSHQVKKLINSQKFPYFICKQDSSISGKGDGLYECVTVPMDFRSQRIAWGQFFAEIWDKATQTYPGFDCSTDTNNGMHVHVSLSAFGVTNPDDRLKSRHLRKFAWFYVDPLNTEFITAISERGEQLGGYCSVPSFGKISRKTAFDECLRVLHRMRGAVNVKGSRTAEVRIFKGIVSYPSLLKNLEFVDATLKFTQEVSYARLTVEHFIDWVNSQPKTKYKALKLFLTKLDPNIVKRIALARGLYGMKRADYALKHCQESDVHINDALLNLLNTRFPKKTTTRGDQKTFSLLNGKLIYTPKAASLLEEHEETLNPFQKAA